MSMLSSGSAANGALPLAAQGNALIASLEPGQEFDVATLDNVVNIFYAGRNAEASRRQLDTWNATFLCGLWPA